MDTPAYHADASPPLPVQALDGRDTRTRLAAIVQQSYREEARSGGDDNHLWASARNKWWSINKRFYGVDRPSEHMNWEWDMHNLWYLYYQASMSISHDNAALDRLALQVIQAREQGMLVKSGAVSGDQVYASTSDGRLWHDLPFLVGDMTKHWIDEHARMSAAQRLSFSKFLAKLASAGVGADDGLCGIGLATFREALETTRPFGSTEDQQQVEHPARQPADLSLYALLPCMNAWLNTAEPKIIQLCEQSWDKGPAAITETGPLVQASQDDEWHGMSAGFSSKRWIYWLHRLEEVAQSAREFGDNELVSIATGMMDNMLSATGETGHGVKSSLDAAYASGVVQHRTFVHQPPPPAEQKHD